MLIAKAGVCNSDPIKISDDNKNWFASGLGSTGRIEEFRMFRDILTLQVLCQKAGSMP